MTIRDLEKNIAAHRNFLCVGLDTDLQKIPEHLLGADDPVFEFNRQLIDATKSHCVAYKINTAFYEALGAKGWESMRKTFYYIGDSHFTIADAKRGDIGNTCDMYAKAFFGDMDVDAITLAPYMGKDSVAPFLAYEGKTVIVLGITSNPSAGDFQMLEDRSGEMLYQSVIKKAATWADETRMMFVAGATRPEIFADIRRVVPQHFLLVPGVGAQGGSLKEVVKYGWNPSCGLLVNSSRGIIYAGSGKDFAEKAGAEASKIAEEMQTYFTT